MLEEDSVVVYTFVAVPVLVTWYVVPAVLVRVCVVGTVWVLVTVDVLWPYTVEQLQFGVLIVKSGP